MSILRTALIVGGVALLCAVPSAAAAKTRSVLFPASLIDKARANVAAYPWAADMQRPVLVNAERWLKTSDDELWEWTFSPVITRSWMVWSDGFCPSCKKDVRMYDWKIDPWEVPWKVRCPHCAELFPKNDFYAYHRSGLDEQGLFQYERADKSLLFNADHPDASDPLHTFGVDDGEGYVDAEGHRWRFIGAYLVYGQWKRRIYLGAVALSSAYAMTGDAAYAHKAAILLDRLADVFPMYDFQAQGLVYETPKHQGQVCVWHDACEETRELALAYDRIFDAARADEPALTTFLSAKAAQYGLDNPKRTWADIQRNIEERLFRETVAHEERIRSNYPRTPMAIFTIKTVLDWPNNRAEVMDLLDSFITQATRVDGVSGEKGLGSGYASIAPRAVSDILALSARLEPEILKTVYERIPVLRDTFRFHLDTWCMESYYPRSGDTGVFGMKDPAYAGISLPGAAPNPSLNSFLWDLYKLTGDVDFVRVLYHANGDTAEGLPRDLYADDPAAFQRDVQRVIDENGAAFHLPSVNKQQWRIAILRGGEGANRRALWVDYDAGGPHGHMDGMNMGLFAKGLDLVPDFGYPPVGYGGWGSPKAVWYVKTASHATVVVDGNDHATSQSGATTLWAGGNVFRAVRVSDPAMIGGERFERTLALVSLDEQDAYAIDCFRVRGGKDHAKFFHSTFGSAEPAGLQLEPAEDFGNGAQMRNFRRDAAPQPGWSVDWTIEDRYKYAAPDAAIHLRYTDLTLDAQAFLAEAWIDASQYGKGNFEWIPCVMVRRTSDAAPLDSMFVSVIEPYDTRAKIGQVRRVPLFADDGAPLPASCVAIELVRADGRHDWFIQTDAASGSDCVLREADVRFSGDAAHLTFGAQGLERAALCRAATLEAGDIRMGLDAAAELVEAAFSSEGVTILAGDAKNIQSIQKAGSPMPIRPR